MKKQWQLSNHNAQQIRRLRVALGCHEAVASILINRGFGNPEQAQRFLFPSLAHIRSPFLLKDMQRAASRIVEAVEKKQKILIFGDYDVDGITASALMIDFFTTVNADITYHIPDRFTEGYGLTERAVHQYAASSGVELIITVDCGISGHAAVSSASEAGIDVIITDHHEVPESLPKAFAVINPKRKDCPAGSTWLSGIGVAFNLVLALRKMFREKGFWEKDEEPNLKSACDLVALGTVADMVPLLKENRIFVKGGLEVLSQSPRLGLKALLEISGATNGFVDTWDLAFRLAPRLNAAGRLGSGAIGCELLTTSDPQKARRIADKLEHQNNERKDIETRILTGIIEEIDAAPLIDPAIVMRCPTWHEGVLGIVASRLVSRYHRPVVLITHGEDGIGKGSARSPEGLDLYEALSACSEYLDRFGGHEAAAGLSLSLSNFPAFKEAFNLFAEEKIPNGIPVAKRLVDAEIALSDITPAFLDAIEQLAPFGVANPEPLFLLSPITVLSVRPLGKGHLKMVLSQNAVDGSSVVEAILFNAPSELENRDSFQHVLCCARWNRWRGKKIPQIIIKDFD